MHNTPKTGALSLAQYVSFVEIFGVKAIEAFQLAGASHAAAARFSTFGFFGGAALTWLLDKFADSLVDAGEILQNLRRRPALARLWRGRTRGGRSSGSGSGGGSGDESSSASAEVVMDLEAAGCKGGSPAGGKAAALPELPAPGLPASSSQVQLFTGRSSTGGPAGAEPGAEGGGAPGPWCAACGRGDADPAVRAAAAAAASAGGAEAAVMYPAEGAALSKLGLLAALAIGIHNLPEGAAASRLAGAAARRPCGCLRAPPPHACTYTRTERARALGLLPIPLRCQITPGRRGHVCRVYAVPGPWRRHRRRHRAAQHSRGNMHRHGARRRGRPAGARAAGCRCGAGALLAMLAAQPRHSPPRPQHLTPQPIHRSNRPAAGSFPTALPPPSVYHALSRCAHTPIPLIPTAAIYYSTGSRRLLSRSPAPSLFA